MPAAMGSDIQEVLRGGTRTRPLDQFQQPSKLQNRASVSLSSDSVQHSVLDTVCAFCHKCDDSRSLLKLLQALAGCCNHARFQASAVMCF